jgi:hypothetical protein
MERRVRVYFRIGKAEGPRVLLVLLARDERRGFMLDDIGDCVQHFSRKGGSVESSRMVLNGEAIKLSLQADKLMNSLAYALDGLVLIQHAGGRLIRVEAGINDGLESPAAAVRDYRKTVGLRFDESNPEILLRRKQKRSRLGVQAR